MFSCTHIRRNPLCTHLIGKIEYTWLHLVGACERTSTAAMATTTTAKKELKKNIETNTKNTLTHCMLLSSLRTGLGRASLYSHNFSTETTLIRL